MPSWSSTRGAAVARSARTLLRSSPTTLGVTLVLLVASAVAGTLTAPASAETASWWAAGPSTTLDGRPWTAVTALLVASDPLQLLLDVVLLLLLLAAAEHRLGSVRTLVAFLLTGALGAVLGSALQSIGSAAGEWWASDTVGDHTFDPLIGAVGALIAATAAMGALWRRRIRVTAFAVVLMFVLYAGDSADVYRMIAGLTGLAVGAVLVGGVAGLRPRRPARSSHRESRALLAAVVAVTAIGPLVAVLSDSGYGPFSFLGRLLQNAFTACSGSARITSGWPSCPPARSSSPSSRSSCCSWQRWVCAPADGSASSWPSGSTSRSLCWRRCHCSASPATPTSSTTASTSSGSPRRCSSRSRSSRC